MRTLDIQNTFNTHTMHGNRVLLVNAKVRGYLVQIIRSYLDDRWPVEWLADELLWGPVESCRTRSLNRQHEILNLLELVTYSGETTIEVEQKMNLALQALTGWIEWTGFRLAVRKTKATMFYYPS